MKHGFAKKERLYSIWVAMNQRCRDIKKIIETPKQVR